MKTGTYEFTHKAEVDSSLASAVYYNSENHTLAIEMHENGDYWNPRTPSVFYAGVPYEVFEGLTEKTDSVGRAYNMFVKDKYQNISNGTVYDVEYVDGTVSVQDVTKATEVDVAKPIVGQTDSRREYEVRGYVRMPNMYFRAASPEEAAEMFVDTFDDEGYDRDDVAVTEVEIYRG